MKRSSWKYLVGATSVAGGLCAGRVWAAHIDVLPYVKDGKLVVSKIDVNTETPFNPPSQVFWEELSPTSLTTSAPGFNSTTQYPLPPNTALMFTVMPTMGRNLSWWNGSGAVSFIAPADGAGMIYSKGVGPNVFNEALYEAPASQPIFGYTRQNGTPTAGLGGTIDVSDSTGVIHKHLTFLLRGRDGSGNVLRENTVPAPADGVYLLSTQLSVSGLPASDTYYTLLSLNAPAALETAADWAQHNLVEKTWVVDDDGSWAVDNNWSNRAPGGAGATANFSSAITADRTVSANAAVTVGTINFNNLHAYTVSGGGTIDLDGSDNHARLSVAAGNHSILSAVAPQSDTDVEVAAGSGLTLTQLMPSNVTMTKSGAGKLVVNNVRQGTLNVAAGRVEVATNGGTAGVSYVNRLSIQANAALDLNDNDLVVNSGVFSDMQALVFNGYRGGLDTSATGIVSTTSQTVHSGTTILALFNNSLAGFSDWPQGSGNTIAVAAIVGKYTYIGDTNMDGQVTPQDYTATDANLNTSVDPAISWFYGDTNFDGSIDSSDYTGIDAALGLGVGNPLAAQGLVAVPEPGVGWGIGVGLLGMRRRRARGHG